MSKPRSSCDVTHVRSSMLKMYIEQTKERRDIMALLNVHGGADGETMAQAARTAN